VCAEVELLEDFAAVEDLGRQVALRGRLRRPEAGGQHVHVQVDAVQQILIIAGEAKYILKKKRGRRSSNSSTRKKEAEERTPREAR
jgi:oxalate decarboxylase/phosphoglucose isomerase-like protein (cupin superfamily)